MRFAIYLPSLANLAFTVSEVHTVLVDNNDPGKTRCLGPWPVG